jgi:hypothetical protein
VTTPVLYRDGVQVGITPLESERLVLQGGLQGTGSVYFGEEAEVSGELRARGNLFAHSRGPNILSGKLAQAGDVYVTDDILDLSGDLGTPNGHFYVLPDVYIAWMHVNHDNTLQAVTLDPRLTQRTGFFDDFTVRVTDGATLNITDDLNFFGGVLRGRFAGQEVLIKKDIAPGYLEYIAGSEFERVDVQRGVLTISGDAGTETPDIHLSGHFTSAASIMTSSDYTNDLFLNNASAVHAALTIGNETTFHGDIFLGNEGSAIAGSYDSGTDNATLAAESRIHGGDLTLHGRAALRIRGGLHTYSGVTRIMSERLILEDQGRLNSTSMILGTGRFANGGGRGTLVLDNSALSAHNDRIPDTTPMQTDGMRFELVGNAAESVAETIGTLRATRGASDIHVAHPGGSAPGTTTLRIERLDRRPGAMMQFHLEGDGARIELSETPALDDGLLAGRARFGGNDFATYGPNGIVAYSDLHSYVTDLAAATAADNVDLLGDELTLVADKQINALRVSESQINLDGHALVIESGGLLDTDYRLSAIVGPGQLTAGMDSGGELLVNGNYRIEADIVDHGGLPVGLTYSSTFASNISFLVLSGANTYSGPTTVNSTDDI